MHILQVEVRCVEAQCRDVRAYDLHVYIIFLFVHGRQENKYKNNGRQARGTMARSQCDA